MQHYVWGYGGSSSESTTPLNWSFSSSAAANPLDQSGSVTPATSATYQQQNGAGTYPRQSLTLATGQTISRSAPTHKATTMRLAYLATYSPDQSNSSDQPHVSNHFVQMEGPFASGGVCEAYRLWFVQNDGKQGPVHVAKRYAQCGSLWHGLGCSMLWYCMVWHGMAWCGVVWCGVVRCGAVRCGAVRCGAVRCGVVWCGAVRCGAVWGGLGWGGVVSGAPALVVSATWARKRVLPGPCTRRSVS